MQVKYNETCFTFNKCIQLAMASCCMILNGLTTINNDAADIATTFSFAFLFLTILTEQTFVPRIYSYVELVYLPAGMFLFLTNGMNSLGLPYEIPTLSRVRFILITVQTVFCCVSCGYFFASFVNIGERWKQYPSDDLVENNPDLDLELQGHETQGGTKMSGDAWKKYGRVVEKLKPDDLALQKVTSKGHKMPGDTRIIKEQTKPRSPCSMSLQENYI